MLFIFRFLVLSTAVFLFGCVPVITSERGVERGPPFSHVDGAIINYALATGQISIQGSIKNDAATITTDQKVVGVPDPRELYTLAYSHSPIAQDEINIAFNGAMVKSISATTTDKSIEIAQGISSILSQTKAIQAGLGANVAAEKKDGIQCAQYEVVHTLNITTGEEHDFTAANKTNRCDLKIFAKAEPVSEPFGFRGFPRPEDTAFSNSEICRSGTAFCFRLGRLYRVKIWATFKNGTEIFRIPSFTVLAPSRNELGYLRFDRRAFVANKASITFDTNGVVSEFGATNPSEVLGFVLFTGAVAGVAAAAVAIH